MSNLLDSAEQPRKKLRKGTRSCTECKRRKIRCIFMESSAICTACLDRGSNCVSQDSNADETAAISPLAQRMNRVESLLETVLSKLDDSSHPGRDRLAGIEALEHMGIDVLNPGCSDSRQSQNAPILALFNNDIFGRDDDDHKPLSEETTASSNSVVRTLKCQASSPSGKLEKLRGALLALLPSPQDVQTLSTSSMGWWLIQRCTLPDLFKDANGAHIDVLSTTFAPNDHPNLIARVLLCLAICIQQLPRSFDHSRLQTTATLPNLMSKYVSFITSHVTSDDELVGNLEGVECLVLQGVYQLTSGNLRRSWLSFRRALNVAQLMGFHRSSLRTATGHGPSTDKRVQNLWYQIVKADRYIALILGLPCGTSQDQAFVPSNSALDFGTSEIYSSKLCHIACLILKRNESEDGGSFAVTQDIDQKLEDLFQEMPPNWWKIPSSTIDQRHLLSSEDCDKMYSQLWHYQLEAFLHLPFMLKAATDRRYEYSKIACLKASREMTKRWLFLRQINYASCFCKVVDFQAFTACITLILGILSPRSHPSTLEQDQLETEDRLLIRSVVETLELYAREFDTVAIQSIEVLKTLLPCDRECNNFTHESMRLTIPHFGTIFLACVPRDVEGSYKRSDASQVPGAQIHSLQSADMNTGEDVSYSNALGYQSDQHVVSFTSSQFPPIGLNLDFNLDASAYDDVNTLMYDSLFDDDLNGNFTF